MELISSRSNPKIKQIRLLKERKGRQASGLVLVEGIHPVGEAVAASQENDTAIEAKFYAPQLLQSVFANALVEQLAARGIPCIPVTEDVFQSIAEKDNPQGILAVVKPTRYTLEGLTPQSSPWCVALVSPQDPGNVGTILRTMDAGGASALLLLDSSVDAYHPGAVRASMTKKEILYIVRRLLLWQGIKKIGVFSMKVHCSLCGTNLLPADEEGICHLCKMSIIFNEDTFPDVDGCAS